MELVRCPSPCRVFRAGRAWSGAIALLFCLALITGCGAGRLANPALPAKGVTLRGRVKGGEQPVSGATLQLYATSTSGDGTPANPLLNQVLNTDSSGAFSITGAYTCPDANALVYLVATGGNPGLPSRAENGALALMAALGPCGKLTPNSVINLNEVTTVASVFPLASFANGYASVGSNGGDEQVLATQFSLVNELVDIAKGTTPGPLLPPGYNSATALIDTLANVIATCVNSAGGVAGDGSACGNLFTTVTAAGDAAPTDTVGALLEIARHPNANTAAILGLAPSIGPFQPTLSATPTSWTPHITASTAASVPQRSSLLGEYLLQEGTGTTAADSSGQGNDATIVGATWDGSADLNFSREQYISLPTALNAANTWQFATYAPPFGFFGYPLAPEVGEGATFSIHPSILCGSTTAHTCLFANTYPGVVSQRFWAFNSSGTQANNALPAGWHVVTLVGGQNGQPDHFYYDGVEVSYASQGTGAFTHPATGNYQIGGAATFDTSWYTGKIAAAWAWSTSLSPADVQAASSSAMAFLQSKGVTRSYPDAVHTTPIVIGGVDSRTFGAYQYPGGVWIDQLALDDPTYSTLDLGINGAALFDIDAMFDLYYKPQIEANTAPTIVIFWGGVNDFTAYPNMTSDTTVASMKSLVQKAKSAGARVIVATEISSYRGEQPKADLDTAIRANALAWGADNIADLAEVPQLGADNAFTNTTYFVDGLHPSPTAEPLITRVMSDAVNELLGSTAAAPHITTASAYSEGAGDRFLQLTSDVQQTVTLPSCVGYSLPRQIVNRGSVAAHVAAQASEVLNGSATIAVGETATVVPVPGAYSTGGCSWQRQ